jgi:Bax protein
MKWITLLIIPLIVAASVIIYQYNNQAENSPISSIPVDIQPLADKPAAARKTVVSKPIVISKTAVTSSTAIAEHPPNFAAITNTKTKKTTFFEYMLPMIRGANKVIVADRAIVVPLHARLVEGQTLSIDEQNKLTPLFEKYNIKIDGELTVGDVDELLLRCDIVPEALVLAQSANESAWGTSRFATKGNNFFGLWCFSRGCGLTPLQRNEGAKHEVAKFDTVNHGVRRYVHTINTNNAYKQLRKMRAKLRTDNESITGSILAEGLLRYSERGKAYVEEIQSMIRFNKLQRYTLDTKIHAPR